jgi:hypothetical protein
VSVLDAIYRELAARDEKPEKVVLTEKAYRQMRDELGLVSDSVPSVVWGSRTHRVVPIPLEVVPGKELRAVVK